MPELDVVHSPQILKGLFAEPYRWGWEFHDPGEPRPHSDALRPPLRSDPGTPDVDDLQATYDEARAGAVKHGLIVGAILLFGGGIPKVGFIAVLVALGLGALVRPVVHHEAEDR